MSSRADDLRNLLDQENCFKMICGAGNEDKNYVKKLAFVYTLAGAKILDVSANVDVIRFAKNGINLAIEYAKQMGIDIGATPYIVASIGMPGDHHVRKSYIDPFKCIGCDMCIPVCPTNAIPKNFTNQLKLYKDFGGTFDNENQEKEIVIKDLCIGCGKCSNVCPKPDIISYRHNEKELKELLPRCIDAGAEMFELHAAVGEHDITMKEWVLINEINPNTFNSMCLDRLNLGNLSLEVRVAEAKRISGDFLIIQADGYPMSGGKNDFNTTLQAVACADVINKKFNMKIIRNKTISEKIYRKNGHRLGVYVILSGGTNELSKKMADKSGVRVNGIAIGTYARDIIDRYILEEDFYENERLISQAYVAAKGLVDANINNYE